MMAGGASLALLLCSLLIAVIASSSQGYSDTSDYSLSEITVLLPYTSARHRVKYQLHAQAGHSNACFKFKAMNSDIIIVEPIYSENNPKGCAGSASISVAAHLHGTSRVSTFVVVEDTLSGRVMRCEVFVAPIASLSVHTTTKSVYRDELEMLQIVATDPEGNTFSTLRGMEFEWQVRNDDEKNPRDILKIVPFKGSNQEVDPLIYQMELQGLQTDVGLVQGVSIGRALVSVQLLDAQYSTESRRASVSILVFESFMISPAHTLYITVGTKVIYHLWNVHQQQMTRVWMPNPLFTWSTSNSTVATVDNTGELLALQLGYTPVVVCAGNLRENEARGAVQVVDPGKLTVSIEEKGHTPIFADEYYLVVGREYIMNVYLYDRFDHPIFYNGTVTFDVAIAAQDRYINMQTQSPSRNISDFLTKSVGHTQFEISLKSLKNGITGEDILVNPALIKTLSVHITEPLSIGCTKAFIPLTGVSVKSPHYQLKAAGGSNDTNWYSTERDIVAVDTKGHLTGLAVGSTNVIVEDRHNPLNRAKMTVVVGNVPPISLRASTNEVPVGGSIALRVGMWDWTGHTQEGGQYDCFSCESSAISWDVRGDAFFADGSADTAKASDSEALKGHCAINNFVASHAGSSIVHVHYGDSHAEIPIFAFDPLRVVDPLSSLVTLASSTEFQFEGGPAPWYQDKTLHYLSAANDEVRSIQTTRSSLRIVCKSHGDFNVTVTAGNNPCESNPRPATSSVVLAFRCHPVHTVRLVPPTDSAKLNARCKTKEEIGGSSIDVYRFPNYYSIPFGYELRDKQDRLFTNSSSVSLDWVSDNKTVATFAKPSTIKSGTANPKATLQTEHVNGSTIARVSVEGYKSDHLREANVISSNIPFIKPGEIEHKIKLILFDKLSLSSFPQSPLFVDNRVFADVSIHGGSGVFSVQIQNTSVAKITSQQGGVSELTTDARAVKVSPITQGKAEVVVGDLCTPEYDSATEVLQFAGTHNLLVHGADKVAVNNTIKFTVQPTDSYGTVFHPSQYVYMDFAAKTDTPNVYIEKTNNLGEFVFRSESAGLVDVVFSVTTTQTFPPIKASKTRQVTVFPPFRVNPSHVTLLVGETLEVNWKGGPYEDSFFRDKLRMEFDSANPAIAVMEPERTVRGKSVGFTTIRISPTLRDKEPEFNVYDELHVTVRQITGIHVRGGSNALIESNSMKLHVEGHDAESPLGFGLRNVFFSWESDNPRVLTVEHLAKTESGMGVSVRIVAHAPGRAIVTALVMPVKGPESHASSNDVLSLPVLRDSFAVDVVPRLGNSCDRPMLVVPHSSVDLSNTFRPYLHEVRYSLMRPQSQSQQTQTQGQVAATQTQGCADIVRFVGKDGSVKAGGSTGHCHVHIAASHGNQAISRHIIVDRVALLVTGPHREGDIILDVRQRKEYYIVPKDGSGNEFTSTDGLALDFEVVPTGIAKLRLDNLTLHVLAERPGKAVVRIFSQEDPKVQDFFELHVRDLKPQSVGAQRTPQDQGYYAKVYTDKPVSHRTPLESVWYRVEFLKNTDHTTKSARYQCSILETQWAQAYPQQTSTANYCVVTPIIPSSPTDVVANLTLVIDSDELQVHHKQSIPLVPIFAVIGPIERTFTPSLSPQPVTLFSATPHVKVSSSDGLRVKPVSTQRPMGNGYVTEYSVEFTQPAGSPGPVAESYYVNFKDEGKGSEVHMTFSASEGSNYLLVTLCSLLAIVLSLVLCGIPCRTFPRSHATRTPNPTSPSTPSHGTPKPAASTPSSTPQAPLDLPPFIPSIHPVTPMPPYATQSPYRAPYTPQSPQSPPTPQSTASPPRFVINTNQNLYDSQRLRGPKF